MDQHAARRRPVLKAALGGVVAVGAVGGVVRWQADAPSGAPGRRPALVLSGEESGQIDSVEVPLDDVRRARGTGPSPWETAPLSSSVYSMVALTWDDPRVAVAAELRTRTGGRWGEWGPLPALHDLPDRGPGEVAARGGTELVWVGASDGVQVRGSGDRPPGLRLLLLQPWAQPGDTLDTAASAPVSRSRGLVPRPDIRGRRRWGAKESWRDGSPRYNRTIQQVHVHHTANSNHYGRHDVPALIRGIYRYHTHHLGWSDVGYNFLVDRFGRIWTGRAGGAQLPVRGAHTLGFNATSTGISVIGNFETATPSSAVLDAIAALAAWKLRPYRRDPLGLARVWSRGSDKYRPGRTVTLPVIDGHRNTNATACPGAHLYQALPEIRLRTRHLIEWYSKVHVLERPELTGLPALGHTLTVEGGRFVPSDASLAYHWRRDGSRIKGADGPSYEVRPADAGARISVRVIGRKRGLHPVRRTLWSSGRVKADANLVVDTVARGDGRLRVQVRVTSVPGVAVAKGRVVVKVAGRRAVVELADGQGVARFGWSTPLDPGRYRVRARYLGDRAHDPARAKIRARVRR